jgi:ADP-ribose pyrophosphatase
MSRRLVFQNKAFEVYADDHGQVYVKDLAPEASAVVAIHEGKLVMVKQYRKEVAAVTYELPGGALEAGEEKEAAARRELLEETGLSCERLLPLGTVCSHAGMLNRVLHLFFTDTILARQPQKLDADERIEVVYFPLDEVFSRIAAGIWNDSKLAHALLLARLRGLI